MSELIAQIEHANSLYCRADVEGNPEKAVELLQDAFDRGVEKLAEQEGNPHAMWVIGSCYTCGWFINGKGVKKDNAKAVHWYRMGAKHGDLFSMRSLGECYHRGDGVEQDEEKSDYWYKKYVEGSKKAAWKGDARAMFELGQCYHLGHGVEQDYTKAAYWFRRAAKHGHYLAKDALKVITLKAKQATKK